MVKYIIPAAIVFFSLKTHAQDYVITQKNDTLRGKVNIQTYGPIDHVQVIRTDKKKTVFTATQVTTVNLNNEIYNPVRTAYGYRMMKLVRPGFVSLYLGRRATGPSDTGFYYDTQFLVKRDGNSIEVPSLSFKKTIGNFLSECANIKHKIDKEDLGRADLDQIITEFNTCIEAQTMESKVKPPLENDDPKILQLKELQARIQESSLTGKKDALEILTDVTSKVKLHQNVPNYQIDGLKNILKESPELLGDFEKLAASLNQQ
ncbi:MAG TPA: hypothetical protein VG737_07935 [Cyclobacteriaceae bacterium]|nr:hypothetical protein [Cyclobacteriaceae bacterium]